MLQIRLLGQFDLRVDGKRIVISSRPGQSLFAYLALTAGTSHRREKLAGQFWPETTDENARKNLRQELWRIRKAISIQPGSTDVLLADEFTVTFNRGADYWLDVAQMEKPGSDLESLSANLSVYQGELLPGFYEDWIILERERVQSIFESKIEQLVEQLVTAERWTAVQEQSERWLAMGNSPEGAYRALMLAFNARGDMAKVSSTYQRCVNDLRNQFGVEPSAETRALYNGLLKGARSPRRTEPPQPSGIMTFLFTDMEGSMQLIERLGEHYAAVLAEHHKILRAAIRKWKGHETDTQGDSFFVTFARAADAVQCAIEVQRLLAKHAWPLGETVRVRMGLHTGEASVAPTGYVGMDVHRAARLGAAGHGGQVLLSQTTRDLVVTELPPGVQIRDLGEHRLRDMKYPLSIYQLVVDGLPAEFPTLKIGFTGTEPPIPGEPPFKGLQYFEEKDADLFFGREALTSSLVNRLRETPIPSNGNREVLHPEEPGISSLSVIIGASGSGKSSLVRAGLIPALKKVLPRSKAPENNGDWHVHILTPTAHPLEALATQLTRGSESVTAAATLTDDLTKEPRSLALFLSRSSPGKHTLLVVDQFEELFTLCRDEFEREAFIDNLLNARGSGVTIIITLRADFYAHIAQYPDLREAVAHRQDYIGPMTAEELRCAIEEPAKRGHWEFEPGLVDLILRDVGDEPGALPLLSHALLETWKRRAGHTLTLKGYADTGGVHGAIAHTAETVYQNLSPNAQRIARHLFLRLTELGEGTEDTRRRASFHELMSGREDEQSIRLVLNELADARLITLAESTVEVAHEALIREWPVLREWLNQDREGLRLHRRLTEAAQEWELLERDAGSLYRGARLAQANEWSALNPGLLNTLERDFLHASNRQATREEQEREEQQRRELASAKQLAETQRQSSLRLRTRNRLITAVGAIALFLAALAGMFGLRAQNEKRLAVSRELAIAAVNNLEIDPERSILLALHALEQRDTQEAQDALHRAVQAFRVERAVHHDDIVEDVTYSPDGARFATASDDGTARIWDAATGREILTLKTGPSASVAFSPDGIRLATANYESNTVTIWDAETGQDLLTLTGHSAGVNQAVFSPDGSQIATASEDMTAKLWDAATGKLRFTLSGHTDIVSQVAFNPDGKRLVTGSWDDSLKIWDTATGVEVLDVSNFLEPTEAVFSPNGELLAINTGNEPQIWDLAKNERRFTLFGHTSLVERVVFSPDGQRLASVSLDGTARVWDVETGVELMTLAGHDSSVFSAAFSPDGIYLATASDDGTARVWNTSLAGSREWLTIVQDQEEVRKVVYSPDGTRLATANSDGTATVFDAAQGTEQLTLFGHTARVYTVVFNSAGSRLATSSEDNTAKVWDANTGKVLLTLSGHGEGIVGGFFPGVLAVAFSPDGKRLATAGADGNAILWDAITGEQLDIFSNNGIGFTNLAFSPDGQHLLLSTDQPPAAVAGEDAEAQLWDITTGKLVFTARQAVRIWGAAFSSDGKRFVTAGFGGIVKIRDATTGKELLDLSGHTSTVNSVAFSADDRYLATASVDGTTKLWDADTGKELLTLTGHVGLTTGLSFSPDGSRLATSGQDGTIRVYLLRVNELVALARSRLTRSLTLEECKQYLHLEQCPADS